MTCLGCCVPAAAAEGPRQHCIKQHQPEEHGKSVLPLLCEDAEEGGDDSKGGLLGGLQPHVPEAKSVQTCCTMSVICRLLLYSS